MLQGTMERQPVLHRAQGGKATKGGTEHRGGTGRTREPPMQLLRMLEESATSFGSTALISRVGASKTGFTSAKYSSRPSEGYCSLSMSRGLHPLAPHVHRETLIPHFPT